MTRKDDLAGLMGKNCEAICRVVSCRVVSCHAVFQRITLEY